MPEWPHRHPAGAEGGSAGGAATGSATGAAAGAATGSPAGVPGAPGGSAWFDDAAGPVVRPYALTGGRTRYEGVEFDLVALIEAVDAPDAAGASPAIPASPWSPEPEHDMILELCRTPLSVVEIASDLELPLGVVRVLLGDLLDRSLIQVRRPAPVAQFPSERVLKEVIDGIRAL
ncbi:DUF742 domain-containing protein [Actinomadura montaniterrae]|uniref:DUF742 domain-containing protein n=1 Tax=Actinomadura montaniterrae TaxID=1803903 RepID=A0A6L3VIN2_9ACTN|nr:DUF742 domain-containing protein [Actinomadura montaniterrae]KAB2370653.1 DUF742 domain-containing protein [Actinomadura montaniterrae]